MFRVVVGVIAAFIAWAIMWFGGEKILSAALPVSFGAYQLVFEAALTTGGQFTPDTPFLLMQIALGTVVSVIAGLLAALISGENKRAPLVLGALLLALGLLKMVMSWSLVPIWYHLIFTALLMPMAILGGRLKKIQRARS
jgi:hypothetical protein